MSSLLARRWPRIVLAAAAVLVLAGGAAIGSGLIELPMTAESIPTASRPVEPSATPTMPATVTPSPTASVAAASPTASPPADPRTPAPTPTAYARPRDILPIGAVIRATADGLRVRHGPSLNSELAGTVNAGDLL